jgi:hypothetical protein
MDKPVHHFYSIGSMGWLRFAPWINHAHLYASATPLHPSADDMLFNGSFVFVSLRDLDVIGSFVKGLDAKVLL